MTTTHDATSGVQLGALRAKRGAPRGNVNRLVHGRQTNVAQRSRLIARSGAAALGPLSEHVEPAMIADWARVLTVSEAAFGMRVTRLGQRIAQAEGITYPGLNALDPLVRVSLIALQGLIDSAEAHQMYVMTLIADRDPRYFKHQHDVATDLQLAHRLRKNVVQGLHDAQPLAMPGSVRA